MASSVVSIGAAYYCIFQLLILVAAADDHPGGDGVHMTSSYSAATDLAVATEEMRRANYFTFVMLLNMMMVDQQDANNLTFLMPNDRILSRVTFRTTETQEVEVEDDDQSSSSWSVREFLLRHSIPSPLLFDHLWHFPSGSTIPSSRPGYVLRVHNDNNNNSEWWSRRSRSGGGKGRSNYYNFSLNNVKIISPNICTFPASSIRCHGIDGVFPLRPTSSTADRCGPSPTAPSDSDHHHHDEISPNPAPSTTIQSSPSSPHKSSSWSASPTGPSSYLLILFVSLSLRR